MNKFKTITLLTILSLSIYPITTYATCTKEEKNNFKRIEDEYKVTYEFDKTTKTYTINLYAKEPEKYNYYISSDDPNIGEKITGNMNLIDDYTYYIDNLPSGKYKIGIMGMTDTCSNILTTKTLNLPKYNPYSEEELCKGIEEFVLCQTTYGKEIDYETFKSRVETYKKTKQNSEVQDSTEKPTNQNDKVISYIKENLVQIIVISIFIILVIITIVLTVKSVKKSRRLE